MSKRISQREARRIQKELQRLQEVIVKQRSRWAQEYVGGTEITRRRWEGNDVVPVAIRTAHALGHAVVCMASQDGLVKFVALPHPQEAL